MKDMGMLPKIFIGLIALVYVGADSPLSQGSDYFVCSAGNDAWDGTSKSQPWKSIARANRQQLRPGDRLLFRGGDSFEGNLVLKIVGNPSKQATITLTSYDQGRAIFQAGTGSGVRVENSGGVIVRDLMVQGNDRRTNKGTGVEIINLLPGGKRLDFVRIENVEAHGFGKYGIAVGSGPADKSLSGFEDVRIYQCRAGDNAYVGIYIYGPYDPFTKGYANSDVAIENCIAHDNPGDPDYLANHSGNGILISNVNGGRIDGCTAYGNGSLCKSGAGGPVGIWAYAACKIAIQNCVSVRNHTGAKKDGGGFDFDGGVTQSIMQYNYSADNDGPGFMVYDYVDAPFRVADNIVRFNISVNDARKNHYGAFHISSDGKAVARLNVYHNTVCVGPASAKPLPLYVNRSEDCRIHNNLFIAQGGLALAEIGGDQPGLLIQGNHYWADKGPFRVFHSGKEYLSLVAWRKQAGMERLKDKDVGAESDPQLTGYLGPILIDAGNRTDLKAFQLKQGSPLAGAALDLKGLFGMDPGTRDFWGNQLPQDRPASVGAYGKYTIVPAGL